jgi:hypothetical protein
MGASPLARGEAPESCPQSNDYSCNFRLRMAIAQIDGSAPE